MAINRYDPSTKIRVVNGIHTIKGKTAADVIAAMLEIEGVDLAASGYVQLGKTAAMRQYITFVHDDGIHYCAQRKTAK